jgi:hypothetical protein
MVALNIKPVADSGQDARRHAGERRLAVVQRRQPAARARPLDEDDHDPEPVLDRQGLRQFDEAGRMLPSSYYDRVVDVMEELVKFTLLTRGASCYLTSRYSKRKEEAAKLEQRVKLSAI